MSNLYNIDINCDMGEGYGAYRVGNDESIMPFVSSVNIACGFHAGDATVMRETVKAAMAYGLKIGAHPGFPDLQGFGRRNMQLSLAEVYNIVLYQIGALWAIVKAEGGKLHHVKPHGALYNMAAADYAIAESIAKAVSALDQNLVLYGLSGSEMISAASACGLRTANEVFADRTYQPDGSLTPRTSASAMIDTADLAIAQAVKMVKEKVVLSTNGTLVSIEPETICIHGDGKHALDFAMEMANVFKTTGISVK